MHRIARFLALGYIVICLATLAGTIFVGPLGYAPFPLSIGPAREPVTVTIWYGTEKQTWLEAAAARFMDSRPTVAGRPIQIQLRGLGSREIAMRTAQQEWRNDAPPTVVSPASSLWIEVLKDEWSRRGSGPIVATGPSQSLVLTPLVLVVWEERARALWSNGPDSFWTELHDALVDPQGWAGHVDPSAPAELKAKAETWGYVKFGHTSPVASNSGAQTLILLAYGYHKKTSGLTADDIRSPDFQAWLADTERAVVEFDDSTGTLMTDMVRFGPSKYDVVVGYENLAIEHIATARERWGDALRVVYPPATLFSDHPYTTLQAPWTTPEQRAAADQFRDFLLSRPTQELALQYGFRPGNPAVPVAGDDPSSPFNKYRQNGVQIDIGQQVETPQGDVVNTLLELWQRQVNR